MFIRIVSYSLVFNTNHVCFNVHFASIIHLFMHTTKNICAKFLKVQKLLSIIFFHYFSQINNEFYCQKKT